MILFGLVNGFALFEIGLAGDRRSGMIMSGAIQLTRYSTAIAGVGILVALISIIIPALTLALTFSVLARLTSVPRENRRFRPALAAAWKLTRHLRPWSMLDVYLLGAVVAYNRLKRLADVVIGAGGYALAAFVFIQVLLEQSLGANAYGARLATLHSTLPTRENRGSCAWIASSSPLLRPSAQMGGVVARVAAPVWYRAGPETLRQQPPSPWRATSSICRPMSCRC